LSDQMCSRRQKDHPTLLYHTSPYSLQVGANIRPRWSAFACEFKVWMTSSLQGAINVGDCIITSFREGGMVPWCGGGFDEENMPPQKIQGLWIYRVKPTGPIERRGVGEWVTSFSVRILEIAHIMGKPWNNRLPEAKVRKDKHMGEMIAYVDAEASEIMDAFDKCRTSQERLEYLKGKMQRKYAKEIYCILAPLPDDKRYEALLLWIHNKIDQETVAFQKQRTKSYHKLYPDPRYKRSKSWKKSLGEDV